MKKKVLFVINTMGRAGAEKALVALLNTLNANDFEIDFLSIINRGEMFLEIPKHVNVLNKDPSNESVLNVSGKMYLIRTILKSLIRKGLIFRLFPYLIRNIFLQIKRGRLLFDKLFWLVLAESVPIPDKEYDLAIGYTEGASTYCVAERVRAKKKAAFVHVDYIKAGYIKALDKKYYEKIDAIFSVSQSVLDNFVASYPEFADRIKGFQNILIPQAIIEASKNGQGFSDNFNGLRILTVARMQPQKAIDVSVLAFAKLVSMGYDNIKWYIIGEGPERPMIEKLISRNNLQDKFILLGATDNPYPCISQCDIYVQASLFEGWCIALAEAIILRRPIIASDFSGSREQLISGETGLIIKLSEDALVEAIKCLIDNEELREKFKENLAKTNINYTKDVKLLYELLDIHYVQ